MNGDEVSIIRLRTKPYCGRVRGQPKRKLRRPSTPQLRKRREAAKLVTIRSNGRIRMVNLPPGWRSGRRVFWSVTIDRMAIGALSPKGMLHHGRYFSSRLRR